MHSERRVAECATIVVIPEPMPAAVAFDMDRGCVPICPPLRNHKSVNVRVIIAMAIATARLHPAFARVDKAVQEEASSAS
jgi:hypothetical protein